MDSESKTLKDLYYNLDNPYAFSSKSRLYKALKKKINDAKFHTINEVLDRDRTATIFKQRPKQTAKRRKLVGATLWSEQAVDLADLSSLGSKNSSYCWLVVCIDVLSHWLILKKAKKKDKTCMTSVFEQILNEPPMQKQKVKFIYSDQGQEIVSLTELWKKYGIKLMHAKTHIKSSLSEISIRHIKKQIFKLLNYFHSLRWVDLIDSLAKRHNDRPSDALFGYSPREIVFDERKREHLKLLKARALLKFYKKNAKSPQFPPGTEVRYLLPKTKFMKEHVPAFSSQVAVVTGFRPTTPIQYRLQLRNGDKLPRLFYGFELSRVIEPQITDEKDLKAGEEENQGLSSTVDLKSKGVKDEMGERRDLFVSETKYKESRTLRSGKKHLAQKMFVIKDKRDPSYEKTVDELGLKKLRSDGLLLD